MSTRNEATLTALAVVERILLEDTNGVQELLAVVPEEQWSRIALCLATLLAGTWEQGLGLTGAVERVEAWRVGALAGDPDA